MNHQGYPYAPSSKDTSSARSWGTAPSVPVAYPPAHPDNASYASSWGTIHTKSVGTPTSFSFDSSASAASNGSSWGSSSTLIQSPNGAWQTGPSSASYVGSISPASSATMINSPPQNFPPSIGSSGSIQPQKSIAIHPVLDIQSRRLWIDLSREISPTPNTYNFLPNMTDSAFLPSITYTQISIQGYPNWSFRVHCPQGLTVYSVLCQVQHYLKQFEGPQEAQTARIMPNTQNVLTEYREKNAARNTYSAGLTRLGNLHGRHFCIGFQAAGGHNRWILHLAQARN